MSVHKKRKPGRNISGTSIPRNQFANRAGKGAGSRSGERRFTNANRAVSGGGSRPAGSARVGLQEHAPGTPQTKSFLQTLKEFLPKKLGF